MIHDLIADLRVDEGWRPYVYDDATGKPIVRGSVVEGYPTIGYGFMVSHDRGGEMPKEIGEHWLVVAATLRWGQLVNLIPWIQDQPEDVQRALGNMAYQMGAGGVYGFENMLRSLQEGDRVAAAVHALDSVWHRENSPARARRVAAMIGGYSVWSGGN